MPSINAATTNTIKSSNLVVNFEDSEDEMPFDLNDSWEKKRRYAERRHL